MKDIKDLTFADDFMFGWIMLSFPDIVRKILGCILHIKVGDIIYNASQKTVESFANSKGVRFDFYAEESERIIEAEMQVRPGKDILRRARYYQSVIDTSTLEKGNRYSVLKESYIVFICMNDPFCKGESVYTVQRTCKENGAVDVSNGTHEVYLNASAWEKEKDVALKGLLRYIYTREATDDLTRTLDKEVEMQKTREIVNKIYCEQGSPVDTAMMQGLHQGKTQTARAMLKRKIDHVLVSECTGLSLEEVKRMAATL